MKKQDEKGIEWEKWTKKKVGWRSRASKARNILHASMQTGLHDLLHIRVCYCDVNKLGYSSRHESYLKNLLFYYPAKYKHVNSLTTYNSFEKTANSLKHFETQLKLFAYLHRVCFRPNGQKLWFYHSKSWCYFQRSGNGAFSRALVGLVLERTLTGRGRGADSALGVCVAGFVLGQGEGHRHRPRYRRRRRWQ